METFSSSLKKKKAYTLASRTATAAVVPQSVQISATKQRESNLVTTVASQNESNNNNTGEVTSDLTFEVTAAQKWNDAQMAVEKDEDRMQREIDNFVKKVLFKKFKFVTNPTEMHFSESKKSLCQFSCKQLNIPVHHQQRFWKNWSRRIKQTFCHRCSDINFAMKETFLGKFMF